MRDQQGPTPATRAPGTSRRRFLGAAGAAAGVGAVLGLTGLPSRALAAPAAPTAARVYQPTWDSVNRHPAAPAWFQDAKFGIYFHWGAFSVPAYGSEWYPRRMYDPNDECNAHHKQVYGDPVTRFPYNKFIDGGRDLAGNRVQFAPKLKSAGGKFDPDDWASLFLAAGAKYAGPVAEHHDGFSMWASRVNPWNSVQRGPKLDLVGLHAKAIRAKGLKFMVAMHHAYNFNGYFEYAPQQTDTTLQQLFGQLPRDQENQLWTARLQELIDGYQPDFIYHDFDLNNVDESQRLKYLAYYFNAGVAQKRDVLTTYKDGFNLFGEVFDYERGGPADINRPYWSTDDSISSSSWCYTQGIGYYSTAQMVHSLIDRVSKGGTMTLNIAPQADGTIPQGQRSVLLDIGRYLRNFGEAVYSTRSWVVYGEGPTKMGGGYFVAPITGTADDTRFTVSKDGTTLYATVLGYPGSAKTISTLALGRFAVDSLAGIELLAPGGSTVPVTIASQDGEGLHLTLPSSAPFQAIAYVVRMRFSGQVPALRESGGAVFDEPGFAAPAAAVGVGRYTGDKLTQLLGGSLSISSISPTPGYRVTGWSSANFRGSSWTVTQDTPDLTTIGADGAIRSLEVTFDPAAFFRIASMSDTLLLDGGGASASGSPLKRWSHDDPSPNMQWKIEDLGYGWFRLTNRTSGLVADGAGVAAGGTGVQNPWSGAGSQQWKLTDTGSGRFTIVNRATGLALASGGPQTAGAPTLLDTPRSGAAQQWELRAV